MEYLSRFLFTSILSDKSGQQAGIRVYLALLLFFLLIFCGGTSKMSQNKSIEQPEVNAAFLEMLAKWQEVRVPSEQHELFGKLAGNWKIIIHFHAGEQSWESQCTSRSKLLHGGRFLLEQITGEIYAPDEKGQMRPEPYTATRILGYDNFKKAYVGVFVDNQNTHLLSFLGLRKTGDSSEKIVMFGLIDEPMLDYHDTTMKYMLRLKDKDHYAWERYALAVGDNAKVLDFIYSRQNKKY